MKKIFITIPWFYPAYKAGGPVQSIVNLVNELDEGTAKFRIFCSNKDLDGVPLENIVTEQWVDFNSNTKVWYCSGQRVRQQLAREVKEFSPDTIFINGIYSWQFNLLPLLLKGPARKIISARGMLHPGALAQKKFKKKIYLQVCKLLGIHKAALFHATDETEKKYIQDEFGSNREVYVAANFPRQISLQSAPAKTTDSLKLLSIALVSPMKNHLKVLESLKEFNSNTHIGYDIYGPIKDKHYWQLCNEAMKKITNGIAVNYHGDISPAAIENVLAQHHVFILPSKSENFGHAIYEALIAGRPVITSTATPWNGLEAARAGINVPADDTAALKTSIAYFTAMDDVTYGQWSVAAREYALRKVDLNAIRKQYEEIFQLK